jgi:poly-gamma-glutamate capsule biosynthesis protein CapA/YwtB (metallophosphatase superfamily)
VNMTGEATNQMSTAATSVEPVKLFLCGDVMTGRGIDQVLPHPVDPRLHESCVHSAVDYVHLAERESGAISTPVDPCYLWGAALDEWRSVAPDVRLINLETSITRSNAFVPKGINYRMSPENAMCLTAAEIDCCVLANNHVLDWGHAGLIDTLQVLEEHGIRVVGAGRDAAQASAPAILDVAGKGRVVVIAFACPSSGVPADWAATQDHPGINLLGDLSTATAANIAQDLESARKPGDIIVASIHWGPNWGYAIPAQHRKFAHALVDLANVSIIHGHSSHHAMAIEIYRNRPIFYGCGDFLNDYEGIAGYEKFRSDLSIIYFVSISPATAECVALDMVPLRIKRFQLRRPTSSDIEWVRATIDRECRQFGARVIGSGGKLALSWPRERLKAIDARRDGSERSGEDPMTVHH